MDVLSWNKDWGGRIDFLLGMQKRGKRVRALDNQPVLWEHLEFIWEAFHRLQARRPDTGMGISPIPMQEIEAYAAREGVEDARRFVFMIEMMDVSFRASVLKKTEIPTDGN